MRLFNLTSRRLAFLAVGLFLFVATNGWCGHESKESGVNVLFIHHSCGGQLLAEPGAVVTVGGLPRAQCLFVEHPNGGRLRNLLQAAGLSVNEASYGSQVGEDTDIHHWRRKFHDQMDRILVTRQQDELLADGESNRVVVFKSCFPNNDFVGAGTEPGDPDSPVLTVTNAKAAYRSLLPLFAAHPEVLFVAMTAPPLVKPSPRGLTARVKSWFSGPGPDGSLARQFNNWLTDPTGGWLADYAGNNVRAFDYFDILTGAGESNWSAYPTKRGRDSHPSTAGNLKAAQEFVAFLTNALQETSR